MSFRVATMLWLLALVPFALLFLGETFWMKVPA